MSESMAMSLRAAEQCAAEGVKARVLWNLGIASRDALCLAMLALRCREDAAAAREHLRQGVAAGEKLLDYAARGFPGSAFFAHPGIYCALLADAAPTAQKLSQWASGPHETDPRLNDPKGEVFGQLLGLFVLDRPAEYAAQRVQLGKGLGLEKDPFWKWLTVYLDLYAAVLRRDQAALDAGMAQRAQAFAARAKDRGFGDLRPEFGGGRDQDLVFDFMGTGIVKVALQRGLRYEGADPSIADSLIATG